MYELTEYVSVHVRLKFSLVVVLKTFTCIGLFVRGGDIEFNGGV